MMLLPYCLIEYKTFETLQKLSYKRQNALQKIAEVLRIYITSYPLIII